MIVVNGNGSTVSADLSTGVSARRVICSRAASLAGDISINKQNHVVWPCWRSGNPQIDQTCKMSPNEPSTLGRPVRKQKQLHDVRHVLSM